MLWTVYSAAASKPSKARPPSLEIARNRTDRGCTQPYRPRRTPAPGRPWANSRCSCRIGRSALAPPTLVVPDVCLLLYASFQAGTDVITLAPKAEHFRRPFCSSCAVASQIRRYVGLSRTGTTRRRADTGPRWLNTLLFFSFTGPLRCRYDADLSNVSSRGSERPRENP